MMRREQALPQLKVAVDLVKEQDDMDLQGVSDDIDYFLLPDGHGGCGDNTEILPGPIWQAGMCRRAAESINVTAISPTSTSPEFEIDSTYYSQHPGGCFVAACDTSIDPKGFCAFMNPLGTTPACAADSSCLGAGICPRKRLKYGGTDSAAADGGCPTGYIVLKNEHMCGTAATLLDHCQGDPFVTGIHNLSKVMDYPLGCFRDNLDTAGNGTHDCVYYNPGNTDLGTPTSIQGTPICIVEQITKVSFGGVHAGGTTTR